MIANQPAVRPPRTGYVITEGGNRRRAWKPARSVARRLRMSVYARDDYTCKHCGYRVDPADIPANFNWNRSPGRLSLDHVTPYSAGGQFVEANLQTLCLGCNMRKGAQF